MRIAETARSKCRVIRLHMAQDYCLLSVIHSRCNLNHSRHVSIAIVLLVIMFITVNEIVAAINTNYQGEDPTELIERLETASVRRRASEWHVITGTILNGWHEKTIIKHVPRCFKMFERHKDEIKQILQQQHEGNIFT